MMKLLVVRVDGIRGILLPAASVSILINSFYINPSYKPKAKEVESGGLIWVS